MSKKMYRVYIDDVETIEELIEFVKGMAASIGMQSKPALKIPEDMLADYPALEHLTEPVEEGEKG